MLRIRIVLSVGSGICVCLSRVWVMIGRLRSFRLRRSRRSLIGSVLLHFQLKADLVFGGHVFKTLLLLRSECTPAFTKDLSELHKLDAGILLEDLGTHFIGEENVSSTCPLGSRRVLGASLVSLTGAMIFNQHTTRIMSRRRHVVGDLLVIATLVLGGTGFPSCLFLRSQVLVHVRRVLRQLTKGHARILPFELLPHGILVKQIGAHVSLRCVHILFGLTLSARLGVDGRNNGVTLGIVSRRWNVRSQLVKVASFVSFRPCHPRFFLGWWELRVHCGSVLGQLTKCHAGVQGFELLPHRILVEKVSTHVALRSAGISGWFLGHFGR
mmetsp:Transcript_117854/g.330025  ORF Transcript_117854/g.330025 Transcript_117854/m.330025 type:complete len:326 (-) Transcript_117854:78-1055(-)